MEEVSLHYLTDTRRKLHALAELSGAEYETSKFIVAELKRFGYKPKLVKTGVFCDVGKGRPRLAFRADIDGLPLLEDVDATGMGEHAASGAMHACGHDGHTAILLDVARRLGGCSDVPLRLIFQHDEEVSGGSVDMIDGGVLDDVDEIYALHLCPELEMGRVGYCYGVMFAGCCEFDLEFDGKATHCAFPENGADAIASAVAVANAARDLALRHNVSITLGKLNGGCARNVVADRCVCEYTLRFYDMAVCEKFMIDLESAALGADDVRGTSHRLNTVAVYPPLVNNALCVDRVRSVMGDCAIPMPPRKTAEDFSNYLEHVAGCMVWLGVRTDKHTSPLHSRSFSFDEEALVSGSDMFMKLIAARRA